MPSRRDMSSNSDALQQLEAAQARITELEKQLQAEHVSTDAEVTVKRYAQRMEILHQIDLGIINADSTEEIIATALKHIRQIIPCQSANVSLIDMAKQEAIIYAVDSEKDTALGHGIRVPIPKDFFEGVDNRKLRIIEDLRLLKKSTPLVKKRLDEGMLSTLNVILMDREQPIGMLWLFANTTGFFTTEHQEIAVEVGNQLAIAIQQHRLSEELAHHAAELEQRVAERTVELQRGKAQVEALLNNSPNGILLIEPDLNIQQTNTAFHRMMGYDSSKSQHRSLLTYIYEHHKAVVGSLVKRVLDEGTGGRAEVQVVRKNGTAFEAELAVELIEGDGLVCTIQDITERKAYERQLRYSASIQQSVSDAVIATDMDLRIQSWNAAAERIYGWTAAEAIGHTAAEILQTVYESEEDRQRIMQEFLAKGGWQREVVQRHKDGRTIHILASTNLFKDDKGQPVGIVSVNRDVTERKLVTEALKKSSAEIHDLYNNAPCGYHSLDKNGVIIQINDTELNWLGYSREEVVGKLKFTDLLPPESLQTFKENFPAFKERGWVNDLQFEVICKDGRHMHILLNGTAIYDEAGEYFQSRSTMFDITELRKAQLEIRQRENHYRALANNLPMTTVFLFDSNLRYLVVEGPDAAFPPEYMEGKTVQEVFTPEIASEILPGYEAALRGESMTIELPANGRLYEGKFAPVFNEQEMVPNGLLVVRDVTEERAAATALRESESRYRLLADNSSDIIIQVNSAFEYIYVSPSVERVLGYTPEEFVGKNTLYFLHPDDAPTVLQLRQDVSRYESGQDTPHVEVRYRHKLGHWVWLERVGSPLFSEESHELIGFLAALRDITARRQAEDALRESEARYRLLAENVTDVIVKTNLDGIRTFVTPSIYGLIGYRPEELIGKSRSEIVHPDDRAEAQFHLTEAINSSTQSFVHRHRMLHKAGHYLWVEVRANIIRDPISSNPSEIIGVVRDITERKRAEDEIRESESRYRLLAENIDDIIMTFSMDRVITYMSPSCERLLGFLPEEVEGKPHSEFIHPEDYPQVIDKTRQAVIYKADSYTNEFRLRHKDNQYSWYEVRTRIIYDPNSINDTRFISVLRDISDRRQAEDALRESEARYRLLVTTLSEGIVMQNRDGRILTCNAAAERILGLSADQMMGVTSIDPRWQAVHEDGSPFPGETHPGMVTLRTGEPLSGVIMGVRLPNGTRHWISINSQPLIAPGETLPYAVIATFSDITSRYESEAALRESEEKYRSLIETMRGGLAIYDPDDRFTYVNDRFCELLGYSREEIIGTYSMDYVDQLGAQQIEGQLDKRQKGESSAYEIRARRKDGTYIHLLVSGSPLLGKNGEYKGSFAVCVDITIQKDAEVALQQALAKEKELGDLKTRFVSMSSHEFRTPLATLLATVETLVAYRHKLSEEQIDQRLEKMKVQIGHLKNIMDDVLMLSRMQARRFDFNPTKINLDTLTRSVLDEFQSRPDVQHQLEYTASDSTQEAILDSKLMRQIISNLVSNAIKYSPSAKVVRIHLDYSDLVMTLTVKDEGIGIPEADLPHLFEPFHRGVNAENISGTGLGLVITKEAVELHGGAIGVESTVGVGTTFIVRIPISMPEGNGA